MPKAKVNENTRQMMTSKANPVDDFEHMTAFMRSIGRAARQNVLKEAERVGGKPYRKIIAQELKTIKFCVV